MTTEDKVRALAKTVLDRVDSGPVWVEDIAAILTDFAVEQQRVGAERMQEDAAKAGRAYIIGATDFDWTEDIADGVADAIRALEPIPVKTEESNESKTK